MALCDSAMMTWLIVFFRPNIDIKTLSQQAFL